MNFEFFKNYIEEFRLDKRIDDAEIYLTDLDGYMIYTSKRNVDQSLIALIAGVYQGSKKMLEFLSDDHEIPTLSLGNSGSSIFVKSFSVGKKELLLSAVLKDVDFQSRYKMYLNLLSDELMENYPTTDSENEITKQSSETKQNNKFLFDDISDEEVDHLFTDIG